MTHNALYYALFTITRERYFSIIVAPKTMTMKSCEHAHSHSFRFEEIKEIILQSSHAEHRSI